MPVYFWKVTFEIPPLRAIYVEQYDAESEDDVRALVSRKRPRAVIRTITKMPPPECGEGT